MNNRVHNLVVVLAFLMLHGYTELGLVRANDVSSSKNQPNILWITAEDLSPHLGCYGDMYAVTPNLDQLARQGVRYTQAFATAPVCTPARSTIITGVHASSLGTQHLRGTQPLARDIRCFTEYLREAGYYCSNNVKEDYNFKTPAAAWDESSDKAHWRGRQPGQPFFSVFNFMTTHQSRTRYGAEDLKDAQAEFPEHQRSDPQTVPLPPYYPDTPEVRINMAALYTQVTRMDRQVGEILSQLEEDGLEDETIVFFYSDHGTGLPRGKRWLHDSGMRVPFIVRFPEVYQAWAPAAPGRSVTETIGFIDLAPTVLSLANLSIPAYMQGRAFLGQARSDEPTYLFGIRDRVDEVIELSRSVRKGRYLYIRNFYPHRARMQRSFYAEITPIRKILRRQYKEGSLPGHEAWLMQPSVPAEELYDTQVDPYQLHNLVDKAQYGGLLKELRIALTDWIVTTKDTSFFPEIEMVARAQGRSPYDWIRSEPRVSFQQILEVADLIGRGPGHLQDFQNALQAKEPAVRFWAANGLAALGQDARPALNALQKALHDQSVPVRLAAAEALCHLGRTDQAMAVLVNGLREKLVLSNLYASSILMVIGDQARKAVPVMRETLERLQGVPDQGWYTRENLAYLLEHFQ